MKIEERYMYRAIELAKKGYGRVNPNPLVGAVIVKNGEIIGEGYHAYFGGLHAERNALQNCRASPEGATLYVTLEPCCHYGKTPPCTEIIIKKKIKRVIIGSVDPNMKTPRAGIHQLLEHSIEVIEGICKNQCELLNEVFFNFVKTKRPFVTMKYAMTMDGKIATRSGESQWITGEIARADVHLDRNKNMAIMVGSRTVLMDNPMLNCRIENGCHPIRIICDTKLNTPIDAKVVKTAQKIRTIIATNISEECLQLPYKECGCELLVIPKEKEHINLKILMKRLGAMGIDSVYLEGGGTLNFSALEAHIVHRVKTYIHPILFGGEKAKTPVEGKGVQRVDQGFNLKVREIKRLGEDFLIESEVL